MFGRLRFLMILVKLNVVFCCFLYLFEVLSLCKRFDNNVDVLFCRNKDGKYLRLKY